MGNLLAQGIILAWPLVTLILFLMMPAPRAIFASLVAAYLLLPVDVGFDFPAIPTLDKGSIPNLATFILAMGMAKPGRFRWPRSPVINILLLIYIFCPLLTGYTNRDAISIGSVVLGGMTTYSSFAMVGEHLINVMPFILGAAMLGNERDHEALLRLMVLAALAYSLPVLVEVVKGPLFGSLIYGVDPGQYWAQQVRNGSFRAMVFLGHGLLVATFLGMSIVAAIGLWRSKARVLGFSAFGCATYLFIVLVLNKSAGALFLTILIAPLLALLPTRQFLRFALVLVMIIMAYPILRANDLVPVNTIESMATSYSAERGGSLAFRLKNEDVLLNHWRERPWFGWGANGRHRVFMVTYWGSTQDITITDGTWIIALGVTGWAGYLSMFGLLCYPFLHVVRARRQVISPATAAIVAMLLFNLLDLIPNSSLRPLTFLIAGALTGLVRVRRAAGRAAPELDPAGKSQRPQVLSHA